MLELIRDKLISLLPKSLRASAVASTVADEALSPKDIPNVYARIAQSLPNDLRRAFADAPLAGDSVNFVGRSQALEEVDEAILAWRNERPNLTAVVASHGAGLTSFLNHVKRRLDANTEIRHFSLALRPTSLDAALSIVARVFKLPEDPKTVAEAVDIINHLPPMAVLIDDGHMLVSRQLGSQAAIQALGAILVATQKRHCWILGFAKQSWRRLSYLYAVDRFFGRVIKLDYLTVEELDDAIERRLYGTGYQWAVREQNEASDSDPFLEFSKKLHALSFGHLALALFILQYAVRVEGKLLHLKDFVALDTGVLSECDMDEQFSLAEIYVHGILSEVEHQDIFRLSPEQSLLRLERLRRMGLLHIIRTECSASSNLYSLAPLMAHATVAHLLNSNRLY